MDRIAFYISYISTYGSQVVLTEVVESERGSNYVRNLHEVHSVFRRIKTSFFEESSSSSPDIGERRRRDDLEVKMECVEKHWAAFKAALGAAENGDGSSLPDFGRNASSPEVSVREMFPPANSLWTKF